MQFLDFKVDRAAAARHGLNGGDVQAVIVVSMGGGAVSQTVEGRERYAIRVRYAHDFRDAIHSLKRTLAWRCNWAC